MKKVQKEKIVTVEKYLKDLVKKVPFEYLGRINVELFFQEFGEMSPSNLLAFIKDKENHYEIAKFVYYNSWLSQYPNGGVSAEWYYYGGYEPT